LLQESVRILYTSTSKKEIALNLIQQKSAHEPVVDHNTDLKNNIVQTSLHSFELFILTIGITKFEISIRPIGLFDISIWYKKQLTSKTLGVVRKLIC
jgi:hypothetical protein